MSESNTWSDAQLKQASRQNYPQNKNGVLETFWKNLVTTTEDSYTHTPHAKLQIMLGNYKGNVHLLNCSCDIVCIIKAVNNKVQKKNNFVPVGDYFKLLQRSRYVILTFFCNL